MSVLPLAGPKLTWSGWRWTSRPGGRNLRVNAVAPGFVETATQTVSDPDFSIFPWPRFFDFSGGGERPGQVWGKMGARDPRRSIINGPRLNLFRAAEKTPPEDGGRRRHQTVMPMRYGARMLSPISSEMAWSLAASPVLGAAAYILWKRLPIHYVAVQAAAGAAAAVVGILM